MKARRNALESATLRALVSLGLAAAAAGLVASLGIATPATATLSIASPSPIPTPSASTSTTPSRTAPTSPASAASPSPSAPPTVGTGQWVVNGAIVRVGGSIATQYEANGNTFSLSGSAAPGKWNTRFGLQGNGPVTIMGTLTGPGPVVDATLKAFGVPITVQGTPGTDLSVRFGLSRGASSNVLEDSRPVSALRAPPAAADTATDVLSRVGLEWLRGLVAFTIIGWLLLLVVPGLKGRAVDATRSIPLRRLGMGVILALDIPLASLVAIVIGLPIGLWWVGVLGLLLFLVLAAAGFAFTGLQIGRLAFDRFGWERVTSFASVPVGVAVLCLIGLLPYVGGILSLLATVYGIGSLLYAPHKEVQVAAVIEEIPQTPAERQARAGRPVVE